MKLWGMIFSLCLVSCASVFDGNSQEVDINANVEGVDVYLGDDYLGKTPLTAELPRLQDQALIFRKNGYKATKVILRTKMNGNFWWNLPFTVVGVTGMSTDYGSGAIHEISPNKMMVRMQRLNFKSGSSPDSDDMATFDIFGFDNLRKERARGAPGVWTSTREQIHE